jgi:DNA-binding transcriptional LysR family regulator
MVAELHSSETMEFRWDDLRVFLAIVRERNLSRAARRLGVNQSTTSRRLAAFEADLGVLLFDRTPDGLVPTAAAEDLLPAAERAEQAANDVTRVVAGHDAHPEGVVKVAMPDGMAASVFVPALPMLIARHPRIRVDVLAGSQLVDLSRREADLAIRFMRPTRGDLVSRKIATLSHEIIASPAYAEAHAGAALRELDWITWDESLSHIPEMLWFARRVGVEPRMRTNSPTGLLAAVRAGLGVTVFATGGSALAQGLAPIETDVPMPPPVEVWLVGHRALRDVPRIRATWDFILEIVESLGG